MQSNIQKYYFTKVLQSARQRETNVNSIDRLLSATGASKRKMQIHWEIRNISTTFFENIDEIWINCMYALPTQPSCNLVKEQKYTSH